MSPQHYPSSRWRLPAVRVSAYPTPPDLVARRGGRLPAAPGPGGSPEVTVRHTELSGVPCVICTPPDATGTALHFHGGGYRLGSAVNSARFATLLASRLRRTVTSVEYRLAPEDPFPAGLIDAATVYEHVLDSGTPPLLAGDSAGGGLAAALTVAASTNGLPLPPALILMSPWLDLTNTASTYEHNARTDQLFSLQSAQEAAAMYLQGHDPADPLVSPLRAVLDRWPPTLLMASTGEVLLDDSLSFAALLARTGTDVESHLVSEVAHAWPAVFPDLDQSHAALEVVEAFAIRLGRHPAANDSP